MEEMISVMAVVLDGYQNQKNLSYKSTIICMLLALV